MNEEKATTKKVYLIQIPMFLIDISVVLQWHYSNQDTLFRLVRWSFNRFLQVVNSFELKHDLPFFVIPHPVYTNTFQ